MVAAAVDAVEQVYAEPLVPKPVSARPIPIKQNPRHNWVRWGLLIGLVIALAVVVELWRAHSQNAISL